MLKSYVDDIQLHTGLAGSSSSRARHPLQARRKAALQRQQQQGSRVTLLHRQLIEEQEQLREGQRGLRRHQKQLQRDAAAAAAEAAAAAAGEALAGVTAAPADSTAASAEAAAEAAAAAGDVNHVMQMYVGTSNRDAAAVQWDDPDDVLQHVSVRVHFTGTDEDASQLQQMYEHGVQQLVEFVQHCKAAAAAQAAALAAGQQQQQQMRLQGKQPNPSSSSSMQWLVDAAAAAAAAHCQDSAAVIRNATPFLLFDQTYQPDDSLYFQQQQQEQQLLQAWDLFKEASLQDHDGPSSFRGLLWGLLRQLKPSVLPWYQQMAAANKQGGSAPSTTQQQQQQAGSSSSVDMVNDAPADLWEAVGGSIASDLILIPPAFRDLLGSGWAGGSGRLPPAVASSGSCMAVAAATAAAADAAERQPEEQQRSAAAARMLVVQYARTLRRSNSAVVSGLMCMGFGNDRAMSCDVLLHAMLIIFSSMLQRSDSPKATLHASETLVGALELCVAELQPHGQLSALLKRVHNPRKYLVCIQLQR
jgi:chemotaxis protein histidine kinase CheA